MLNRLRFLISDYQSKAVLLIVFVFAKIFELSFKFTNFDSGLSSGSNFFVNLDLNNVCLVHL